MKKIFRPARYIWTVKANSDFFKKYYFHSVLDLNLVKLDSILQYGIFCKEWIEKNSLVSIYTHEAKYYDSKNGNTFVSLAEYTDETKFSKMFESFTLHTLSCVSLLVDKKVNVRREGERETFFDDEVFCYQAVPKSAICGILLPEHLTNLKISEVSCLTSDIANYSNRYLKNWITCMEKYFGDTIDSELILAKAKELRTIFDEYSRPERWVGTCLTKQHERYGSDLKDVLALELERLWGSRLGVKEPKYMEVIDYINKEHLPVYEIGEKALKKLR